MPNELTLEKLKEWQHYLTVGRLKELLAKYPDDAKVLIQRVEDKYYDGVDITGLGGCETTEDGIFPPGSKAEGWPVVLKQGEAYNNAVNWNKEMDAEVLERERGDIGNWPFPNPVEKKYKQEEMDELLDQYSPAFGVALYSDDTNNLYIDLHY